MKVKTIKLLEEFLEEYVGINLLTLVVKSNTNEKGKNKKTRVYQNKKNCTPKYSKKKVKNYS